MQISHRELVSEAGIQKITGVVRTARASVEEERQRHECHRFAERSAAVEI